MKTHITRLKMHGRKIVFQDAPPDFKEGEHPRAPNGQFTSNGGITGHKIQNGITAPKENSASHLIWSIASKLKENGINVSASTITSEAYNVHGKELNPSTVNTQLYNYKKYHAPYQPKVQHVASELPPDMVAAENKIANNAENFNILAKSTGLPLEGNYNGITYYKAGNTKLSYMTHSGTWVLSHNGEFETGSSLNKLHETLTNMNIKHIAEKPPKTVKIPKSEPAAPPKEDNTTHSSKNYASAIPASNFKFTTNGISDEKGFNSAMRDSIKAYKGTSYKAINSAMRFSTSFDDIDNSTMKHILNLQRAFAIVPVTVKDNIVGRKIGIDALKTMAKDAGLGDLKDLQVGNIIRDEGIVSTSLNAHVWKGDVNFRIKVPAGSKAIDLSQSINKSEVETMLPPGSKFKITEVKMGYNSFKYYIECELIP